MPFPLCGVPEKGLLIRTPEGATEAPRARERSRGPALINQRSKGEPSQLFAVAQSVCVTFVTLWPGVHVDAQPRIPRCLDHLRNGLVAHARVCGARELHRGAIVRIRALKLNDPLVLGAAVAGNPRWCRGKLVAEEPCPLRRVVEISEENSASPVVLKK